MITSNMIKPLVLAFALAMPNFSCFAQQTPKAEAGDAELNLKLAAAFRKQSDDTLDRMKKAYVVSTALVSLAENKVKTINAETCSYIGMDEFAEVHVNLRTRFGVSIDLEVAFKAETELGKAKRLEEIDMMAYEMAENVKTLRKVCQLKYGA